MFSIYQIVIPALLAFLGTLWIHPKVLKIAIMKDLVDNPSARKLQRRPIPNMGGSAVFFGIIIGLCSSQAMFSSPKAFMLVAAMLVMLYVGTMDDILSLTPSIRFVIEILIICWLMFANKSSLNCFHGLWGLGYIPDYIAIPLTIVSCVGIINAINLIDGVNGLSSGFCLMASILFATMFYHLGNAVMMTITVSAAGAIIPFFLHNVFGYKTRMFIGDSGTLLIGTMMSMCVISLLEVTPASITFANKGMGLIPFEFAVLSIPVFDTLRVMSSRILRGKSPFHPDKTHLHHIFIDLGFSHIATTTSILSLNFIIVAAWFIAYKLGASIDMQLYLVMSLSIIFTFGLYKYLKIQLAKKGKTFKILQSIGKAINLERKGIWEVIQKGVDKI